MKCGSLAQLTPESLFASGSAVHHTSVRLRRLLLQLMPFLLMMQVSG